jgi:hypothetical protein
MLIIALCMCHRNVWYSPNWDELHRFWSELPNYNPMGVSTLTAGQDFGGHVAALFAKLSNNQKDEDCVSNMQSSYGSGILNLNDVDPSLETLNQDWNLKLLERSFAAVQNGGDDNGSPADGGKNSSKDLNMHLYFILANYLLLSCPNTYFRLQHLNLIPLLSNVILPIKPLHKA